MKKLILALILLVFSVPAFADSVTTQINSLIVHDDGGISFYANSVLDVSCTTDTRGEITASSSAVRRQMQAILTAAILSGKSVKISFNGCSGYGAAITSLNLQR